MQKLDLPAFLIVNNAIVEHRAQTSLATLRWALGKAAVTMCQSDAREEAVRQRLVQRIGKPKANVAMARRLLRILYAMVRDGKPFQRGPQRDRTSAANHVRARKRRKEAVAA